VITLKEWLEIVEYRITEGDTYLWHCFGRDAHTLSSWNGEHDGHSFYIVFDTKTQEVYNVETCDYKNERAYRYINPDYMDDYKQMAADRSVNHAQAWDDVDFVDLETKEDWIEKARAIKAGEDYDTRVQVPLTLDDDSMFKLMKMAHELDITFNELVEDILKDHISDLRDIDGI
jgi:hypothetical protein